MDLDPRFLKSPIYVHRADLKPAQDAISPVIAQILKALDSGTDSKNTATVSDTAATRNSTDDTANQSMSLDAE